MIEGVHDIKAARYTAQESLLGAVADGMHRFYQGKKIAYVYRASTEKRGTKIRVIWGKITRPHGT
jgi:ribosomal protein L35AE/L33A